MHRTKALDPLVSGLTRSTARRPDLSMGLPWSQRVGLRCTIGDAGHPDADLATSACQGSIRWRSAT